MTAINPKATALLLMDFQNAILARLGDVAPLLERANRLRAAAHAAGIRVIHIRVAFTDDDFTQPLRNKMLAMMQTNRFVPDGEAAAEIDERLKPAANEEVFRKNRVGAFSIPGFEGRLKDHGINTLVLAGVATGGVVLSTTRQAADRDYRLIVVTDCCADADAEIHRVLTEKVLARQADMLTLDEFTQALG